MREASYTQSFRCLMKRAPQYKYIGCNPFSGRSWFYWAQSWLLGWSGLDWKRPTHGVVQEGVRRALAEESHDQPWASYHHYWRTVGSGSGGCREVSFGLDWNSNNCNWRPHRRTAPLSGQPENCLQVRNHQDAWNWWEEDESIYWWEKEDALQSVCGLQGPKM